MRLGCGKNDALDIKNHPFFKDIDWEMVFQRKLKTPEITNAKNELNTYNSEQFIENLIGNDEENEQENHISGWSFIRN